MDRRLFLQRCAAAGAIAGASSSLFSEQPVTHAHASAHLFPVDGISVPDEGWNLWLDRKATWRDDTIYLPEDVELAKLPANAPTGGWQALYARHDGDEFTTVTLPTTVEQHFWGRFGLRPYTPDEYRYGADDAVPRNGAYEGVSWWWRSIDIPAAMHGQRIFLKIRGARMRAEVYLNEQLVGYSIMEELPFECDLTTAARPGGKNTLAIRITNPGGRYDWVDGSTIRWGKVNLYRSHGFGGIDREITVHAAPMSGRIIDAWVLNTPEPRSINFTVRMDESTLPAGISTKARFAAIDFQVLDAQTGKEIEVVIDDQQLSAETYNWNISCPAAKLWDLDSPYLYHLRATWTSPVTGGKDVYTVAFGFRWFAPEGLGTNALFRLNGRRIKIYTSISWGFWGLNGLWPTPELADREVTQAKRLGLNCLNFHRNVGKEDLFRAHDRHGVLRYMEPGGGKLSVGKLPSGVPANSAGVVMEKSTSEADLFSQRFMLEKCRAMVRAYRSHPSLIQYTLQNEIGADLKNPETFTAIRIMHEEDPSRSVVLNDGFTSPERNAAQAWFSPYSDTMRRSDQEAWAGWWNNHQGAGDQWYDEFYKDADHFTYDQPLKTALVEFGEMEGIAVPDNHPLMIHQIESGAFGGNGKSYDLADHKQITAGCDHFLDRWGFRTAFPSAEKLYKAIGSKMYESWQQYIENVRINDAVDFAALSGWESTAIENHSGIVDNLRNFRNDPDLLASSLRPVRAVAKQHHLCYAAGETAVFDLHLLNDTGKQLKGKLRFSMVEPGGKLVSLGSWDAPANVTDQFSYTLQKDFTTPPLTKEGIYRFRFACDADPNGRFTRDIWVANTQLKFARKVSIGVSGIIAPTRKKLAALLNVEVNDFKEGEKYDLIVASGVVKGSKLDRVIGEETGLEDNLADRRHPPEQQTTGDIPAAVYAAVKTGTPLLALVPDDFLADGVAKQLATQGAFTYRGQVGDTRAPWMGNWTFIREHVTFAGMPANRALSIHYQAHGKQANGLLVERVPGTEDLEVIAGYSRDHDREIGAASFLCKLGSTRVLVHRMPDLNPPLQHRWLANSVALLTGVKLS